MIRFAVHSMRQQFVSCLQKAYILITFDPPNMHPKAQQNTCAGCAGSEHLVTRRAPTCH